MLAVHQHKGCFPTSYTSIGIFCGNWPWKKAVHTLLLPGILIFVIRVPFPELHGLSSYVATSTTVAKFLEHNFRINLIINALTF